YGHAANGLAISLPAFMYFAHHLQQGKLLSEEQFEQLLSPYTYQTENNKFQHGWAPYPLNGQSSFGFTGGGVSGFRYFPDQDMTIIYMSNGYKYFPIHNTVINHLAGMVDKNLADAEEESKTTIVNLFLDEDAPQDLSGAYASWRAEHPNLALENTLNSLGYALMGSGRMKRALTVFKQNVKEYPDSWNVYDSLGEAYAEVGKLSEAITNYKKSISLNPDNQNGKNWLEELNRRIK
ncbi:MAG: tetratricopeptide repeat protein, partial [Bacteroidota bacterium]